MYLHLGKDVVINEDIVVGIFDLDSVSYNKKSREFISSHQKENAVIDAAQGLPKSVIVCREYGRSVLYISQISARTLLKRIGTSRVFKNLQ